MFSDKQKQSWQNIKAPRGLLEKIENSVDTQIVRPKGFKRIALPLIAASFIFIFAVVLIIGRTSSVEIYLNDSLLTQDAQVLDVFYEPMMLSRSSIPTSSLELTVDTEADTFIKTENGEFSIITDSGEVIFTGCEYTLNEKSILLWTYPLNDGTCKKLSIVCGMQESVVVVEYDEFNAQQNVKCFKN